MKATTAKTAIPKGKPVELRGQLPGEGAAKGEPLTIPVTADDGKHRREIQLKKKIGEGGEGVVFETNLGSASDYVAKIYLRDKLTDVKCEKLKLMLTKSIKAAGICFPVALIKNDCDETVGFLMPRAKGIELSKSIFQPKLLQIKFPSWTRRETIQLCLTILEKIKYLNDAGIILGDINGQNILVVSPKEVYFVDCDSYQVGNYPCPAGTDNFTPPEAQGKGYGTFLRKQSMENFAIATLLFMIMLPGKAPYSAVGGADPAENIRNGAFAYESADSSKIPPGKWGFIWSHMSFKVRQAFAETFRKNGEHFYPHSRLSAEEWIQLFKAYQHAIESMLKRDPMAIAIFPTRPKMKECRKCGKMYVPNPNRYRPICPECEAKEHGHARPSSTYGNQRETFINVACATPGCPNTVLVSSRNTKPAYCKACKQKARDEAAAWKQQEAEKERARNAAHQRWLNEVWVRYPCKNPKCNNIITLYNRDQANPRYRKKPEYCDECWQDARCTRCGYVAAKWMHDERGGLCRRCYERDKQAAKMRRRAIASLQRRATASKPAAASQAKTNQTKIPAQSGASKGSSPGCWNYLIWAWAIVIILTWLSTCSSYIAFE